MIPQIAEHVEYLLGETGIEAERRFVDQEQARAHDERTGDLEQTTLTAAERARGLVAPCREHRAAFEHSFSRVARIGPTAHQLPTKPEVLVDGHVGKHGTVPQHEGDARVPEPGVRAETGHVAAADLDAATANVGQTEDRMQDRGLASAGRSDQAQRLPFAQAEVDAVQDLDGSVSGDEAIDAQHRVSTHQLGEALAQFRAVGDPAGAPAVAGGGRDLFEVTR